VRLDQNLNTSKLSIYKLIFQQLVINMKTNRKIKMIQYKVKSGYCNLQHKLTIFVKNLKLQLEYKTNNQVYLHHMLI
jgi:hypothetical protein